jgi:photosystem II stability/assembly factor-like uncharacterized protein
MYKYKKLIIFLFFIVLCVPTNIYSYSWEKVTSISPKDGAWVYNYWLDIYFLPANPNAGWICGRHGKVLRTINGGANWTGVQIPGADHLESVHFVNAFVGYTSGPAGIYKSVDGGLSWTDVTPPNHSDNSTLWGNYFLNANYGLVIGGGCGLSEQHFWLTTDGGSTWTETKYNEPNSGLTDLILYPDGNGYCVSSGNLWQTLDSGRTWMVYSDTGTNLWNEEITHLGSTFVLPYSGDNCSGGGPGGGIRYTHTSGLTWHNYETGSNMFGIFCENPAEMWACGFARSIYYSSDGGASWENKRCGIDPGNLDDIWFKTANEGWVVGEDIYRFAPDRVETTKDSIFFGNECYPGEYYDTVYVENVSFNMNNFVLTIEGQHPYDFALEIPETNVDLLACQFLEVPIKFTPSTVGTKRATIKILQNGIAFYVKLVGRTYESTVATEDTLLIIPHAPVGKTSSGRITFTSRDLQDSVLVLENIFNDIEISENNDLPIGFFGDAGELIFDASPTDTGWVSARYRVHFDICDHDTTITVRAYGVSPIIESDIRMDFKQKCLDEVIEKIEIQNNGNAILKIEEAFFLNNTTDYQIIGWSSGSTLPVFIDPGKTDTVIVRYYSETAYSEKNTLRLVNNDLTTARGIKNVYDIGLNAEVLRTKIFTADDVLDFGDICLGDSLELQTDITNQGSQTGAVYIDKVVGEGYTFKFATADRRLYLNPGDSNKVIVKFKPESIGKQDGYILLIDELCGDSIIVDITGVGIDSELEIDPKSINELVQRKQLLQKIVTIKNTGNTEVTIKSLVANPDFPDMNFTYIPTGDQVLAPDASIEYTLSFIFDVDTTYVGEICVVAEAPCELDACIQVQIKSHSLSLDFSHDYVEFEDLFCQATEKTVEFSIKNVGIADDNIFEIKLEDETQGFSLANVPALPKPISTNEELKFDIKFLPVIPGEYSTRLIIKSDNMYDDSVSIDVSGNYYKTSTSVNINKFDFGIFEVCDDIVTQEIVLTNSGNYDDTLKVSKINSIAGVSVNPNDFIYVAQGETSILTISLTPNKMSDVDKYTELITLVSQICPDIIEIEADFEIIDPNLTIVPDLIEFGKVWITEDSIKTVVITNNSQRTIEVTEADFAPPEPLLELLDDPKGIYNPGDSRNIRIKLDARVEKTVSSNLYLVEETSCIDSLFYPITGEVPDEEYEITVRIGRYVKTNNTPVTFQVELENSSPHITATGIDFQLNFNPFLFYPDELFIDRIIVDNKIDFVWEKEGIVAHIPEKFAENLLKKDKVIIFVSGRAFSDPDDSTDLVIEKFEINSTKEVTVNKIDGKLVVEPHCTSQIGLRLSYLPQIESSFDNFIRDDDLNVEIEADKSVRIFFRITDYMGRVASTGFYQLSKGVNQIDLDVRELSSGTYFLRIQSEFVQQYDYQFMIVR